MMVGHDSTVPARSIAFWNSLWDEATGGFRFAPGCPPTLMATAYAVLGLELAGGLGGIGAARESAIVAFLMSGAQPDGSFADPTVGPEDLLPGEHDSGYFREETTTFCQQALDALLAPAPPPRRLPAEWLAPESLAAHLESFPWRNPWLDSNRVMFVLSQLCHEAERHRRPELLFLVDAALDWVDAHQDPQTGLWRGPHPASLENAMAATFHFAFYYGYRGRPLPHVERIVDSCLSLQQAHGLFSGDGNGHTCLDYDALDLLAKASLSTDYRRDAVRGAMRRAEAALLMLEGEDGGFCHCGERPGHSFGVRADGILRKLGLFRFVPFKPSGGEYSVCRRSLSCPTAAGNAFSTWFRLLSLLLATQQDWLKAGIPPRFSFRRLPFLGYHDALAIQSAQGVTASDPLTVDPRPRPKREGAGIEYRPLVSVIVPARNARRYLDGALSGLRAQTYPGWECIVVDDGSEDGTGEIARRWAGSDSRIRVIAQENRGLAAARNAALALAGGELVHCLDADDRIGPRFYESVLRELSRHRGGDVPGTCAFSSARVFADGCRMVSSRKALPPGSFSFGALSRTNPGEPVCYVFERRILEETGVFDESLRHCQDWDLWLRFSRIGVRFVPVDAAEAFYRIAAGSLSTNYVSYVDAAARVMRRAAADDPRCSPSGSGAAPVAEEHVRAGIAGFWLHNVMRALNAGSEEAVGGLFEWARCNLPPEFWSDPGSFGVRPEFHWAGCPPDSECAVEIRWRRTGRFLALLERLWPELPGEATRNITGSLARATVIHMSERRERLPVKRYAALAAEAMRSMNPRAWRRGDLLLVLAAPFLPGAVLRGVLKIRAEIRGV
ncbi:MAG: glycosyltransferase family A protein [Syntrophobacteraceae bacterium]